MSERNEMTCAELADVATELALGVLTGRERAAALAHLDSCEACREEVRQLMATSDQLLALLPPAEPPAGFETRVLDRLGLSAPAAGPGQAEQGQAEQAPAGPGLENGPGQRKGHAELLQAGTRNTPRRRRPWVRGATRPGAGQAGAGPAGPGRTSARPGGTSDSRSRTGRVRRALAATAVGVAVIAAGLGGWRIGVGSSPSPAASSAAAPLTSATLLSATHQNVGDIYVYSGARRWLYMSVDLGSGNEPVTCQVIGANGKVTTVGSFRLNGGYGGWGSPDPADDGTLHGAQLVSADGTVLATATFTS